jgi:SAM-dependent methyltransferase
VVDAAMQFVKIGGSLGVWLLSRVSKDRTAQGVGTSACHEPEGGAAKLEKFLGADFWRRVHGKRVMDLGCGNGQEVVAVAQRGAATVFGVDVRPKLLTSAAALAVAEGVTERCVFLNALEEADTLRTLNGSIDVIYSLDCFEHYPDPGAILDLAHALLVPGGALVISFGPPWYHPFGAHMSFFCPLPWVHLLFTENTILTVRARYRSDRATKFEEVDGGLNRMSVGRFERLIRERNFSVERFKPIPVRKAHFLVRNRVLREFFTSVVQCSLLKDKTHA